MSKQPYNKERFNKLVSNKPSGFLDRQLKNRKNRKDKMRSAKLALNVLAILDHEKMSQVALAEKMGVTPQQVSKILRGKSNFTFETIDKLELALGYSLLEVKTVDFEREARKVQFVMKEMTERIVQVKNTKKMAAPSLKTKEHFRHIKTIEPNSFDSLTDAGDNLKPTGS